MDRIGGGGAVKKPTGPFLPRMIWTWEETDRNTGDFVLYL